MKPFFLTWPVFFYGSVTSSPSLSEAALLSFPLHFRWWEMLQLILAEVNADEGGAPLEGGSCPAANGAAVVFPSPAGCFYIGATLSSPLAPQWDGEAKRWVGLTSLVN